MKSLVIVALSAGIAFADVKPFALRVMNGNGLYESAKQTNAVYVLENYFLDCIYCNQNAPNVDELADFYKNDNRVQVLDLGIDRTDMQYTEWIRRHRPNHPVLNDGARVVTKQLGTTSYPTVNVVNGAGVVLFKSTGVWSGSTKARLHAVIDQALADQEQVKP